MSKMKDKAIAVRNATPLKNRKLTVVQASEFISLRRDLIPVLDALKDGISRYVGVLSGNHQYLNHSDVVQETCVLTGWERYLQSRVAVLVGITQQHAKLAQEVLHG